MAAAWAQINLRNCSLIVATGDAMAKVKGWDQALVRLNISKMSAPWKWSHHDCCIFAADGVFVQTGIDFAADFRGQYETQAEADAMLANLGYADVAALASSRLPEILIDGKPAPMHARRGDIVLIPGEQGDYLAICDGLTAVGPTIPRGIRHAPMEIALRAWRVE